MVAPTRNITVKTRVRISKSGQITLPAKVRQQLGVDVGEQVDIVQETDGTVQIRSPQPLTIEEFAGSLGPPPQGQALMEYLRDVDEQPMVRSVYEDESKPYDPD